MPKASTAKASSAKKSSSKASPKAKPASKKPAAKKKAAAGDQEVTIDRRTKQAERRESDADAPASADLQPRKKVNRRRQIDPTTCERDYTDAEVEFMNAMDEYKRTSGRMFPTCSEVLEVIRGLGYVQLTAAEIAAREPVEQHPAGEGSAHIEETIDGVADEHVEEHDSLEAIESLA